MALINQRLIVTWNNRMGVRDSHARRKRLIIHNLWLS